MDRKPRILFLPRWYPNRYDPMPGLFIRRQAEALTPFCDVAVIYLHPDPECPNAVEAEFSEENNVRVLRIYYQPPVSPSGFLTRFFSLLRLHRAAMKAWKSIRGFNPDVVHAHILTRMGFIGWRIARKARAPLVISEHWSRYFPASGAFTGLLRIIATRWIVGRAAAVIAVSGPLKEAMEQSGLVHRRYEIIPNVVTAPAVVATRPTDPDRVKEIVHISCFDDRSKNISGFLRSIKKLSEHRSGFRCRLVGEGPDLEEMKSLAGELGLAPEIVEFTGLLTGGAFDEVLAGAAFTVLSSRYETFGTVVAESLAAGVPVVATATGIAPELIGPGNGLLVPPGDDDALTQAMDTMLNQCDRLDRGAIRDGVKGKFDPETIGRQLYTLYLGLIGKGDSPTRGA